MLEKSEIPAWGAVPNQAQFDYHKEELAAFVHFGPNTFMGVEWGDHYEDTPPNQLFQLQKVFDAETLVSTIKQAGFKKIIITAKHHDGFALWNSQCSDYDVANTNYQNGRGDILAEISAAATRHNLNMGLYLSPWDIHEKSYGYFDAEGQPLVGQDELPLNGRTWEEVAALDELDYNEFYNQQLIEILGNPIYGNAGRFNEIWMDGAKAGGAKVQHYDFERWFATIQRYQGQSAGYESDAMLFNAGVKTTVRWIGNEEGISPDTHWATTNYTYDDKGNRIGFEDQRFEGIEGGEFWTVPEADARITSGWFWGENKKTPKSIKELANIYFKSVGRNSPLLLNIPPNTNGTLDRAILERVKAFGENIRETFANDLAAQAVITVNSTYANSEQYHVSNLLNHDYDSIWAPEEGKSCGVIQLDLKSLQTFDVISIEEAIQLGQRITAYCIEISEDGRQWRLFERGTTIGAKRLARQFPVIARFVKISVDTASKVKQGIVPVLSRIGIYKASDDFSLIPEIPKGVEVIKMTDELKMNKVGFSPLNWSNESNNQLFGVEIGSMIQLTFYGTGFVLIGTQGPLLGELSLSIDQGKQIIVNTMAEITETGKNIFRCTHLEDGYHVVQMEVISKKIEIEAAYVINNGGSGFLEFERPFYTMPQDCKMTIKVRRIGGSKGRAEVDVQANPMTAMQYQFDPDSGGHIIFEEGQTEQTVEVRTKQYDGSKEDVYFDLDFGTPKGAEIGFVSRTRIYIRD